MGIVILIVGGALGAVLDIGFGIQFPPLYWFIGIITMAAANWVEA